MKSLKTRNPNKNDPARPFIEHVRELRSRLFSYLFVLGVGSFVGYWIHPQLITFLTKPLAQPLFYSTVTGGFNFVFQVSLFFGFVLSIPFLLFQIVRFVQPALPPIPFPQLLRYLVASIFLLLLGMGFAYFVSLPSTLHFLGSFGKENIMTLISVSEYFSFVVRYITGFGIAFQLPLIILVIDSYTPLSLRNLLRFERVVIVLCFVAAAILTPTPDIFNQAVFALPLILLYQLSILLIWLRHRSLKG